MKRRFFNLFLLTVLSASITNTVIHAEDDDDFDVLRSQSISEESDEVFRTNCGGCGGGDEKDSSKGWIDEKVSEWEE